jgi:NhaA family Na+:H+ antiporter
MISNQFKKFLKLESASGIILFIAGITAIVIKNTSLEFYYDSLLAGFLPHLINDGLMSIFFFLVGLEIKREFIDGELSSKETSFLPVIAACGGMLMPALVYLCITNGEAILAKGWAIPCATDIAFSLAILSLFGSRIKPSLKVFLTALAIIDDLGAILIIALFYTANLYFTYLIWAALCCLVMAMLNLKNVTSKVPYFLFACLLWYFIHLSGIHSTIAGVLAAFFVPYKIKHKSPLLEFEKLIHPYVAYLILPLFAFFNAGLDLHSIDLSVLFSKLTLGITLGLFLGKQLGVMLLSWIAIKARICKLPADSNWIEFYGISALTGVGFTMSLFIDHLAFNNASLIIPSQLGIISGSFLSGIFGFLILYSTTKNEKSRL